MEFQGWTRYYVSWIELAPGVYDRTLEGVAVGLLSDQPANWNEVYGIEGHVFTNPDIEVVWNNTIQAGQIRTKTFVPPFIPNGHRFVLYCQDISNFNQTKKAIKVISKFMAYMDSNGFSGSGSYSQDELRDILIAMKTAQDLENNPTP